MARSARGKPCELVEGKWPDGTVKEDDKSGVEIFQNFARRLRDRTKGMSNRHVGELAGVHGRSVGAILRGTAWVDWHTTVRLEKAFGPLSDAVPADRVATAMGDPVSQPALSLTELAHYLGRRSALDGLLDEVAAVLGPQCQRRVELPASVAYTDPPGPSDFILADLYDPARRLVVRYAGLEKISLTGGRWPELELTDVLMEIALLCMLRDQCKRPIPHTALLVSRHPGRMAVDHAHAHDTTVIYPERGRDGELRIRDTQNVLARQVDREDARAS